MKLWAVAVAAHRAVSQQQLPLPTESILAKLKPGASPPPMGGAALARASPQTFSAGKSEGAERKKPRADLPDGLLTRLSTALDRHSGVTLLVSSKSGESSIARLW